MEDIIKRPWTDFLSNPEDPDEPLRTRAGLLEYLISSYGNTGTNDDAVNKLVQGVFSGDNWFMLSNKDLDKFHQGWQVELPQELTYVAIVTLQNAIIGELLVSSYYNSDKTVGYFRELYDQSEDIVSFWENSN